MRYVSGTLPGLKGDTPKTDPCLVQEGGSDNDMYSICNYDHDYVYKKIWIDFCGELPEFDVYKSFRDLDSTSQKVTAIDEQLDECLDSNNWMGKDGVVWEIGHYKIRPVGSLQS